MRSFPRWVFPAALLLAGIATPAIGADFTVPPVPHHFVTDEGNVLGDATRTAVESELKAYQLSTGHQVIVWIGKTTGSVPLETWTAETAHTWKIGRSKVDDGVVLFLFMDDRKVRIEVGYGLEGKLTDADAQRIIDDDIAPNMRSNDPDRAIADGVAAILTTITPTLQGSVPVPEAPTKSNVPGIIIACIMGAMILVSAIVISSQLLRLIWGGILIVAEGQKKAEASMDKSWWRFFGGGLGTGGGGGGSSSSDSSSSDDDDFDAGGGDFGGGGASGSW